MDRVRKACSWNPHIPAARWLGLSPTAARRLFLPSIREDGREARSPHYAVDLKDIDRAWALAALDDVIERGRVDARTWARARERSR